MEKGITVLLFCGLFLIGYAFFKPSTSSTAIPVKNTEIVIENGFFKLARLDQGVLAQYGDIKILNSDFAMDPVLHGIENEKMELLIVEIIKQYGLDNDHSLQFYLSRPRRPLESLLNQYDLDQNLMNRIEFLSSEGEGFANIDGKKIQWADISKKNYLWGALQTKEFNRKVDLLKRKISNNLITLEAKKNKKSTQDFIQQVVLKDNNKPQSQIQSYVVEKILERPIDLNLQYPNFNIELKPDWTTYIGAKDPESLVVYFTDYYSAGAKELFEKLPALAQKFPNVQFGLRPIFPKQNQYQDMLSQLSFCIWVEDSAGYWPFMMDAIKFKSEGFENNVYNKVEELGLDLKKIKKCFYEKNYKNVVEYHQEYARYLGLKSGPLVFVKGKVFVGNLAWKEVEKTLREFNK